METVGSPTNTVPASQPESVAKMAVCPQCHQPVRPEYYFCPNCGKKLEERPLSTSVWAQIWLYFFTLILMPITCYLIYTRWQGLRYFRSNDPKARQIGLIAIILLIISIILLVWGTWAGITQFQQYIQNQENSINYIGL